MEASERKAFWIWKQLCGLEPRDSKIAAALQVPMLDSNFSWLELCLEGQWFTQEDLAKRLGLQRSGYRKLEAKEKEGKITIETLRLAAEAMDCEFVYFVRPKSQKAFSVLFWEQVFPRAFEVYKKRTRTERINPLILGKIAQWLSAHTKFRREKGWDQISTRDWL